MSKKQRMYFHGECVIAEIKELPENLRKRNDKDSIMIAESETIGNEHRVEIKDGVEFYEDENGVLYMRNTTPTNVYCLHENRHDTIELLFLLHLQFPNGTFIFLKELKPNTTISQ